jgi:hypothetical protein
VGDLARAALLAMLDRSDEAWPLAEAPSKHLSDVSGGSDAGYEYLALIATIEGDRERACRHSSSSSRRSPSVLTATPRRTGCCLRGSSA